MSRSRVPQLNMFGRQVPSVHIPYLVTTPDVAYTQMPHYPEQYQYQNTDQRYYQNPPQRIHTQQPQYSPLNPNYYYPQSLIGGVPQTANPHSQAPIDQDQIYEPVPQIRLLPSADLQYRQFPGQIDHNGCLVRYTEKDELYDLTQQYTEYIQEQVHCGPRYEQTQHPSNSLLQRRRWDIKEIYEKMEATFDQKGNIVFNNTDFYKPVRTQRQPMTNSTQGIVPNPMVDAPVQSSQNLDDPPLLRLHPAS